ncbi:hypothetical protein R1sor_011068 [Riccia sorocarpa]|uniref:Aldehyde dehydrogenase domain-containing protein n=1 Tax=Riccia sorocarpa TaxID=122646 RepID=A0ABD3HZU4_9MARC
MRIRGWSVQQIRRMTTVTRPRVFDVVNPATGTKFAEMPNDSPEDVAEKFEKLSAGQKGWSAVSINERMKTLQRFNELLLQNVVRT